MKQPLKPISFKASRELHQMVRDLARQLKLTPSQLIRLAIRRMKEGQ